MSLAPTLPGPFKHALIASFDVDPQQGFSELCPNELPVAGALEIVDELNKNVNFAQYRICSKDAHPPNAVWITKNPSEICKPVEGFMNVDVKWPEHCTIGTKGAELLPGLNMLNYDFIVWKGIENNMHPYGACYHDLHNEISTGVIEWLHARRVKTVIVGGLATDYCVKTTVLQLSRDFTVIVNLAACRGVAVETTQKAIDAMQYKKNVIVTNDHLGVSACLKAARLLWQI